jgi:hypothetical protein
MLYNINVTPEQNIVTYRKVMLHQDITQETFFRIFLIQIC